MVEHRNIDGAATDSEGHGDAGGGDSHDEGSGTPWKMYLQFAGMILTAMFVMYWVMFVGSWELSHVRFSESRVFMAITMGGTMGLVMLGWMLHMYQHVAGRIAIIVGSVLLLGIGVFLDRSQITVDDIGFMRAMIPHHSLAITRAERFDVDDVRVCELAREISLAQRREILEMDWLIDDINENGVASNPEEAQQRPVPEFDVEAGLDCPSS